MCIVLGIILIIVSGVNSPTENETKKGNYVSWQKSNKQLL